MTCITTCRITIILIIVFLLQICTVSSTSVNLSHNVQGLFFIPSKLTYSSEQVVVNTEYYNEHSSVSSKGIKHQHNPNTISNTVIDYNSTILPSENDIKDNFGNNNDNNNTINKITLYSIYNTKYTPIDQVHTCNYITNVINKSNLDKNIGSTTNLNNIQDAIEIDNSQTLLTFGTPQAVTTFLACCPTIYDPFEVQQFNSRFNNNNQNTVSSNGVNDVDDDRQKEIKSQSDLTNKTSHIFPQQLTINLTAPQFQHLHRAGCGHSIYINNRINVTTNQQEYNNEYPHIITTGPYRNIPSVYLLNYNGENNYKPQSGNNSNTSATIHTFVEFPLNLPSPQQANSTSDYNSIPAIVYDPHHIILTTTTTTTSHMYDNLMIQNCSNKTISQSGEGFHRSLRYIYNLTQCNDITVDPTPLDYNNSNNDNQQQYTNTKDTNNITHFLFLQTLPHSTFIDPYQVAYSLMAEQKSLQRELQLLLNGDDDMNYEIQALYSIWDSLSSTNTTLTSTTPQLLHLGLHLYDFIDVEAQLNNAYGNIFVSHLKQHHTKGNNNNNKNNKKNMPNHSSPMDDIMQEYLKWYSTKLDTLDFTIPLHLRYVHSQFDSHTSTCNDSKDCPLPSPTASILTNSHEARYKTFLFEPVVFKWTSHEPLNESEEKIDIPSYSTLLQKIITMRLTTYYDSLQTSNVNPHDNTNIKHTLNNDTIQDSTLPPILLTTPRGKLSQLNIIIGITLSIIALMFILMGTLLWKAWETQQNEPTRQRVPLAIQRTHQYIKKNQ